MKRIQAIIILSLIQGAQAAGAKMRQIELPRPAHEMILTCKKSLSLARFKTCKNILSFREIARNQYLIRFSSEPSTACEENMRENCIIQPNLPYRIQSPPRGLNPNKRNPQE
jgi:hypothetical protein